MKIKNFIGKIIPLLISVILGISIFIYIQKFISNPSPSYEGITIDQINSKIDNDKIELKFNEKIITLEVAKSFGKLAEGLMNRTEMQQDSGMLFIFDSLELRNFWMKNTLISLDIIYLDDQLKVVNIHEKTLPNQINTTYPSELPAKYVIEMNAGWAESNSLEISDQFEIVNL